MDIEGKVTFYVTVIRAHLSVTLSVSWSYTLEAASPVARLICPTMCRPATQRPPGSVIEIMIMIMMMTMSDHYRGPGLAPAGGPPPPPWPA